jgi:SWI/SNF-related matrix-associated actin-dependent regulator 1 of chromatin subfamily A
LFLTGTPIENYPKEIWPLAATICPAKFGNWWAFAKRYCGLHQESHNDHKVWVSTGNSHLSELQQRLRASFMVRRLKHDVLKELPPKRRQLVILGDQEIDWSQHPEFRRWKALYERDYEAALARIEAAKTLEEYKRAVKALDAFVGIAFTEMSEFRHKTALAKLPLCLRYIDDLLANGLDNVVIFAHHKDVLEKIYAHYKEDAVLLYGGTPMEERGKIVLEYQNGPKRVFVGGLKAAGTGITLTKASTVIFIEIDWVPATLSQAEDRLCRIGQQRMVHVIHLVLNNTLDVNMSQKVIAKQDVIDKALDRLPEHIRMKQVL